MRKDVLSPLSNYCCTPWTGWTITSSCVPKSVTSFEVTIEDKLLAASCWLKYLSSLDKFAWDKASNLCQRKPLCPLLECLGLLRVFLFKFPHPPLCCPPLFSVAALWTVAKRPILSSLPLLQSIYFSHSFHHVFICRLLRCHIIMLPTSMSLSVFLWPVVSMYVHLLFFHIHVFHLYISSNVSWCALVICQSLCYIYMSCSLCYLVL